MWNSEFPVYSVPQYGYWRQCLHILTDIPKLLSGLIDQGTLTADSFHGALNAFIGLLRILDQILDDLRDTCRSLFRLLGKLPDLICHNSKSLPASPALAASMDAFSAKEVRLIGNIQNRTDEILYFAYLLRQITHYLYNDITGFLHTLLLRFQFQRPPSGCRLPSCRSGQRLPPFH